MKPIVVRLILFCVFASLPTSALADLFSGPILLEPVTDTAQHFSIKWQLDTSGTDSYDGDFWKISLKDVRTEFDPDVPKSKDSDTVTFLDAQHEKPVPEHGLLDGILEPGPSGIFSTRPLPADNTLSFFRNIPVQHGFHKDFWSGGVTFGPDSVKTVYLEAFHAPEPSSLILFSTGLGLFLGYEWRRRAQQRSRRIAMNPFSV